MRLPINKLRRLIRKELLEGFPRFSAPEMDRKIDPTVRRKVENHGWNGDRITFVPFGEGKELTLYHGVGNQAGMHGYAAIERDEKWSKNKSRVMKKLDSLMSGEGTLVIKQFRNITRSRGRWITVARIEI